MVVRLAAIKRANVLHWLLFSAAVLLLLLAFIAGEDKHASRAWHAAWQLGHMLLFFLWMLLALLHLQGFRQQRFGWQLVIGLSTTLLLATAIEILQYLIGRDADMQDVVLSLAGSFCALVFASPARRMLQRRWVRLWLLSGAVVLLLALTPLLLAIVDETQAQARFPLMADFSSPLEIERWEGLEDMAIVAGVAGNAGYALRVPFTTERYSTVRLKYFPGDWRGYRFLEITAYVPDPKPLPVTVRIHDRQHESSGMVYADRYTQNYVLQPGGNTIRIPLAQVHLAPRQRVMDLGQIQEVMLFAMNLPQERIIYLERLRLTR